MSKTILIDCDGVVLNWEYAFHVWLEEHGHEPVVVDQGLFYRISDQYGLSEDKVVRMVRHFNESASIGFLPPLRDAIQYITRLHNEHGYVFHAITSVIDDPNVVKLRTMNLHKLFGESTFSAIECLPLGSTKKQALRKFANSGLYWIEDHIKNAEDGLDLGLKPLLMEHGYTLNYDGCIPKVKNWKEIYHMVIDQ